MSLLDVLGVWDTESGHGWTEMVHLGFSILLVFSSQPNLQVYFQVAEILLTWLYPLSVVNLYSDIAITFGMNDFFLVMLNYYILEWLNTCFIRYSVCLLSNIKWIFSDETTLFSLIMKSLMKVLTWQKLSHMYWQEYSV